MTNMFAPLTTKEKVIGKIAGKSNKDEGIAIVPVPNSVALEIPAHSLGKPVNEWCYKDATGQPLFYVCRFILQDGTKEDRPLTYRKYKDGSQRWAWKGLEAPRPLYGLDRLAARLNTPVIVCEGEKATDAATGLFPSYIVMTSPNGAKSPHKADWSPLKDRDVTIWPDHDDEGQQYAQSVSRLAKKVGARSVRIVSIFDEFPDKWDLADELPQGKTQEDINSLLNQAELVIDPLENLAQRVSNDPGVAFKSEVLDALSVLKREDISAFVSIRSQLKKAGAGVVMLDDAIEDRRSEIGDIMSEPDHLELARDVINRIGPENILGTSAHVWRWHESGVWRSVADRVIKQDVQRTLEDNDHSISRGLVDAVTDVLKTEIHAEEHDWNPNHDTINVLNGELHWNGTEWELQAHCREHYRTTQIPLIYNPQAECPRFVKFLDEIFRDDLDKKDKIAALVEMIGYTLVSHALFERFALLVGSGANGKSVVMEVIKALVGRENVSAVQPSQFGNKFQRAHLHLKLANLVTEIAEGGEIADAELKAITSGELTTAEHKNKDPFDFCPFSTCWFGANHMPHTRDFSDALFRRALVIPFNRVFKAGVDADPHLKTKLVDELPGIMNMGLQAFGGVLKRGSFTEPQSCLIAKEEWRKEADQAMQFVEECCFMGEHFEVSSADLYANYRNWAESVGITRKLNKKNFSTRLVRIGCKLRAGTAGKRMITGIRVISLRDE